MTASALYLPADVLVERMMRRVTKAETGCWLFEGCLNSKGYGCVGSGKKGKSVLAHRLVVIARDGAIPDPLTVDHMCEVKRCVNPDHLQVVTRGENTRLRYTRHIPPPRVSVGAGFTIADLMRDLGQLNSGAA